MLLTDCSYPDNTGGYLPPGGDLRGLTVPLSLLVLLSLSLSLGSSKFPDDTCSGEAGFENPFILLHLLRSMAQATLGITILCTAKPSSSWNIVQKSGTTSTWKIVLFYVCVCVCVRVCVWVCACVCVCVCVCALCRAQLFTTAWTVACQSICGILQARILEWVAISYSRGLFNPGIEPASLVSSAMVGGFFTTALPGKPYSLYK